MTEIAAIFTGLGTVIAAIGGVLLTIKQIVDRAQKAHDDEAKQNEANLEQEHKLRLAAELLIYKLKMLLAQHGIEAPDEPDKPGGKSL